MMFKRLIGTAVLFGLLIGPVSAEDFRLPDAQEMSTFSPEALQLYSSGVRSIDRVDYGNAYNYLAKAAQLQPDATRLNMITAALALKHGRTKAASEARGYYETAVLSYQNVLRQRGLDDNFRRDVTNRLKVAIDERDNLAQRDVRREALGTEFVRALNRKYAPATPGPTAKPPAPVPAQPTSPIGQMYAVPGATPVVPGVGVPPYPSNIPTANYPVNPAAPAMPGMPGPEGLPPPGGSPGGLPTDDPAAGAGGEVI